MTSALCRAGFAFLFVGLLLDPRVGNSTQTVGGDKAVQWAEARFRDAEGPLRDPSATSVSDHFGPIPYLSRNWWSRFALARSGRMFETACKGSFWVYDPIHRIAAASEFGDVTGDTLLYSGPPPVAVPVRDLSKIVSSRGLHLGMSVAQAAKSLGVAKGAAKPTSRRDSLLYTRKDHPCEAGRYHCSDDATVVFRGGSVVAISLQFVGP